MSDSQKNPKVECSLSDIVFGVSLGEGAFGNVRVGWLKSNKHQKYAVKTMKKAEIIKSKHVDHIENEKNILEKIQHPFVLEYFGFLQDDRYIYFLTELLRGGDLFTYHRSVGHFSQKQTQFYGAQIVCIFEYLHGKDIIYRDLKPENIMIGDDGYLKLIDFGFAKVVRKRTYTICGTPEYIAPEILLNQGHSKPVDWWTVGILVYEMLAGFPPFQDEDPMNIYRKIINTKPRYPEGFDSKCKSLVKHLLRRDLSKRFGNLKNGVDDIKNHRFFEHFSWSNLLLKKLDTPYLPKIEAVSDKESAFSKDKAAQAEKIATCDPKGTLMGSHLQTPEDITEFPYFPSGTTSILSQCLTRDVWEQLKDKKDKYGFSFKQAIFSGSKWTESGVGVYAGSHESYYAFAPLFDKIIQKYHGHGKTDKHVSDMDYTKLNCPKFPADEDSMINSTRIRVGRNLADYPLGSAVTRDQRLEIENKITTALSKFTGDLKGKYYSLASMTPEEKKQLVEDHFLFKGGDKYLQSSFLEREWPEARGIFHNEHKTFLVWVNEEDQLRIISMQQGSDIREVFERLSRAVTEIEKVAKFAHDDHLGYITSCPTNLGTGMRASVHIKLPKLGKKQDEFQAIADRYHVQIRGAHGEHTETDDGVFDISNLRRLGHSEVDLVQDMYNGVKAMIKREKEL